MELTTEEQRLLDYYVKSVGDKTLTDKETNFVFVFGDLTLNGNRIKELWAYYLQKKEEANTSKSEEREVDWNENGMKEYRKNLCKQSIAIVNVLDLTEKPVKKSENLKQKDENGKVHYTGKKQKYYFLSKVEFLLIHGDSEDAFGIGDNIRWQFGESLYTQLSKIYLEAKRTKELKATLLVFRITERRYRVKKLTAEQESECLELEPLEIILKYFRRYATKNKYASISRVKTE